MNLVSVNNFDDELLNNQREANRNGTPNHLYDYSDNISVIKQEENKKQIEQLQEELVAIEKELNRELRMKDRKI